MPLLIVIAGIILLLVLIGLNIKDTLKTWIAMETCTGLAGIHLPTDLPCVSWQRERNSKISLMLRFVVPSCFFPVSIL